MAEAEFFLIRSLGNDNERIATNGPCAIHDLRSHDFADSSDLALSKTLRSRCVHEPSTVLSSLAGMRLQIPFLASQVRKFILPRLSRRPFPVTLL